MICLCFSLKFFFSLSWHNFDRHDRNTIIQNVQKEMKKKETKIYDNNMNNRLYENNEKWKTNRRRNNFFFYIVVSFLHVSKENDFGFQHNRCRRLYSFVCVPKKINRAIVCNQKCYFSFYFLFQIFRRQYGWQENFSSTEMETWVLQRKVKIGFSRKCYALTLKWNSILFVYKQLSRAKNILFLFILLVFFVRSSNNFYRLKPLKY